MRTSSQEKAANSRCCPRSVRKWTHYEKRMQALRCPFNARFVNDDCETSSHNHIIEGTEKGYSSLELRELRVVLSKSRRLAGAVRTRTEVDPQGKSRGIGTAIPVSKST